MYKSYTISDELAHSPPFSAQPAPSLSRTPGRARQTPNHTEDPVGTSELSQRKL